MFQVSCKALVSLIIVIGYSGLGHAYFMHAVASS